MLVFCLAAGQGGLAASWCQGAGRTTDRTGGDLALLSGHSEVKFISIWNAAFVEILVAQITKQKGLSVFLTISDSYHLLWLFGYSLYFILQIISDIILSIPSCLGCRFAGLRRVRPFEPLGIRAQVGSANGLLPQHLYHLSSNGESVNSRDL